MCDSRLSVDDAHGQASRMSALDLYEDLLINDEKDEGDKIFTMQEILSEKHSLEEQNSLLQQQLEEARIEARKYLEEKASLQKNFNSLLATAKAELERKNGLLSHYLGESGPRTGKPSSSSRSHTPKVPDHLTKKKGLLDLYKGKRVDEKELTTPKSSASVTPTTLLQHRGEKMVGVATRVIGSSFENIGSKEGINFSFNHQTDIRTHTDKGQGRHIHGQGPQHQTELTCVSSAPTSHDTLPLPSHASGITARSDSGQGTHTQQQTSPSIIELTSVTSASTSHNTLSPLGRTNIRTQTDMVRSKRLQGRRSCQQTELTPSTSAPNALNNRMSLDSGVSVMIRDSQLRRSNSPSTIRASNSKDPLGLNAYAHQKSKNCDKVRPLRHSPVPDSSKGSSRARSRSEIDFTRSKYGKKDRRSKEISRPLLSVGDRRQSSSGVFDKKDHAESSLVEAGQTRALRDGDKSRRRDAKRSSRDPAGRSTEVHRSLSRCRESGSKAPVSKSPHRDRWNEAGSVLKGKGLDQTPRGMKSREPETREGRRNDDKKYATNHKSAHKIALDQNHESGIPSKQPPVRSKSSRHPSKTGRDSSKSLDRHSKIMCKGDSSTAVKTSSHSYRKSKNRRSSKDLRSYSPKSINKDICKVSQMTMPADTCPKEIFDERNNSKRTSDDVTSRMFKKIGISGSDEMKHQKEKNEPPHAVNTTDNMDFRVSQKSRTVSSNAISQSHVSIKKPAMSMSSPQKVTLSCSTKNNIEELMEGSECMDFQMDLELDYDEDSLMNREIMRPGDSYEYHDNENPLSAQNKIIDEHGKNLGTPSEERSRTEPQTPKSSPFRKSANTSQTSKHLFPESVPNAEKTPGQSSNMSKISGKSSQPLATSADVKMLALTPKFQPQVRLIDIRKSPVNLAKKRKVVFESDMDLPNKKDKRQHVEKSPTQYDNLDSKTALKNVGNKVRREKTSVKGTAKAQTDEDSSAVTSKEIIDPFARNSESRTDIFSAKMPSSSNIKIKYAKTTPELNTSPSPNEENVVKEVEDSTAELCDKSASSSAMDVGMEVEIETSSDFSGKAKGKSKKKSKKRTLKIKMKTFKKDKERKSSQNNRNSVNMNRVECSSNPMIISQKLASKPTEQKEKILPEPPPVLSQWLDSCKKRKKRNKQSKTKERERREKLPESGEALIPSKTRRVNPIEKCSEPTGEDIKQAAMEKERIEIANAVASICDNGPLANPAPAEAATVSFNAKSMGTGGNWMRSYNNAALKWLYQLSLDKLKNLDASELPLDLSLKKKPSSNKAKDLSRSQHTSAVVNLFSGQSAGGTTAQGVNENKSISFDKNLVAASEDQQHFSNKSTPVIPPADHGKSTKEENFDELLKKHSEHQKASSMKRKKEACKSDRTLPKTKKPRRVALERVEMPDLKAKERDDMVSPLSRCLWMTSLEKCQERRKKRSRWSSEVSEYDDAIHSSDELDDNNRSISEQEKAAVIPTSKSSVVTPSKLSVKPVLPDSVMMSQQPKPLPKTCQTRESSEASSNSSHFSVNDLFTDMSLSSWQLSEESKSRFHSFAKAVKVLSPLKLSPDKAMPPASHTDKNDVRRKVLQSP